MPALKKETFEALHQIQHRVRRVALFCAGLLVLSAGVVAQEKRRGEVGCVGSVRFQNHSAKKGKETRDVDAFSQSARSSPQSPFKLETQVVKTHQCWERRSDLIAAAC